MKRNVLAATAVAALLSGGAVWAGGSASGSLERGSSSTVFAQAAVRGVGEQLVVWDRGRGTKFIDVGKADLSSGDYVVGNGVWENKSGKKLAVRAGQCMLTSIEPGTGQCQSSVRFEDGSRLVLFETQFPGPVNRGVIVGGTKRFRDASGIFHYRSDGSGPRLRIVLTFTS